MSLPTHILKHIPVYTLNPSKKTMASPCRTRSTNTTQHPGQIVKPAKRRTPAEAKAVTEAKEAAKAAKKQAKKDSINRAAEL